MKFKENAENTEDLCLLVPIPLALIPQVPPILQVLDPLSKLNAAWLPTGTVSSKNASLVRTVVCLAHLATTATNVDRVILTTVSVNVAHKIVVMDVVSP